MIKRAKGLEVLLEALKDIVDKQPDIILLIAGKVFKNDIPIVPMLISRASESAQNRAT